MNEKCTCPLNHKNGNFFDILGHDRSLSLPLEVFPLALLVVFSDCVVLVCVYIYIYINNKLKLLSVSLCKSTVKR
jgi:hypothetical protein